MGMMVFADSGITGGPITIERITPEMAKRIASTATNQQSQPPAGTQKVCDCPDLYGDRIVTMKQNTLYAGLSWVDCALIQEATTFRQKLKMDTAQWGMLSNLCKAHGW
ncbi:hypothetical protein KY310_01955, partial [Candidatus Woesearchaeota archaeon]|nr:hypothetical protein [Candidatus Woesearchaeota archaeon]